MIQKKWSKVKLGKDCKTRRNAQIITDNLVQLFGGIPAFSPKENVGATIGRPFSAFMIRRWRAAERRPYKYLLEIGNLGRLQLKLEFVRDQGNKFGIRKFLPKKNVGATCGRPLAGIGIWGRRAANGRPYGENLEIRRFRKLLLKTRAMYSKFGSFPRKKM